MFSFLLLLLAFCVSRSLASPLSTSKDPGEFSFSSLSVRSADGSSTAGELKSSFDLSNGISADTGSWASGPPTSFQWNEATAAQILSVNTDSDLLTSVADSEINGTSDPKTKGCRAQVRGKVRIRNYSTSNQEIGEGGQFCAPADAPAHGSKPLNLIVRPESGASHQPIGTRRKILSRNKRCNR